MRELTGYGKAPKLRGRPAVIARVRWILEIADRRGGLSHADLGYWRRLCAYTFLVLGLRLVGYGWRRHGWLTTAAPVIAGHVERHTLRLGLIGGYVSTSDEETPLIRMSLLLRLMRRYSASVELLTKRLQTGLPSIRTRFWLAQFLDEIGEKKAALEICSLTDGHSERPAGVDQSVLPPRPKWVWPGRRRYGIVVLTMFDSEVFRTSLRSLLNSDYAGEIVIVEDGHQSEALCRGLCATLPVKYVKAGSWLGSNAALNLGLRQLDPGTEMAIFAHNDVLWPPKWFNQLDATWERVTDSDKVSVLNLGYLQFRRRLDTALTRLFLDGGYEDLVWLLKAMRQVGSLVEMVQDVQVHESGYLLGLCRDPWNDWLPDLRTMTGMMSVAASFPMHVWREMDGFDPEIVYGVNSQLHQYSVANRKWMLWTSNAPLIHLLSTDTHALSPADREIFNSKLTHTYDAYERKYGWTLEHYQNTFFGDITVTYADTIVDAVNESKFQDVDFVFDEFEKRLREKTLSNCDLTWCRAYSTCKYLSGPETVGKSSAEGLLVS